MVDLSGWQMVVQKAVRSVNDSAGTTAAAKVLRRAGSLVYEKVDLMVDWLGFHSAER
jgi:hypothetical protein